MGRNGGDRTTKTGKRKPVTNTIMSTPKRLRSSAKGDLEEPLPHNGGDKQTVKMKILKLGVSRKEI